jgi:hypothetical protein
MSADSVLGKRSIDVVDVEQHDETSVKMARVKGSCVLCARFDEKGHNALPFKDGLCCNQCFDIVEIQKRRDVEMLAKLKELPAYEWFWWIDDKCGKKEEFSYVLDRTFGWEFFMKMDQQDVKYHCKKIPFELLKSLTLSSLQAEVLRAALCLMEHSDRGDMKYCRYKNGFVWGLPPRSGRNWSYSLSVKAYEFLRAAKNFNDDVPYFTERCFEKYGGNIRIDDEKYDFDLISFCDKCILWCIKSLQTSTWASNEGCTWTSFDKSVTDFCLVTKRQDLVRAHIKSQIKVSKPLQALMDKHGFYISIRDETTDAEMCGYPVLSCGCKHCKDVEEANQC